MISNRETPTRTAGMIQADAGIILAVHHLKNKLQFPVDCRHVYGHQDGKNKKKQEKREQELAEKTEEFAHETKIESSKSEAETAMATVFQLGRKTPPRRSQRAEQAKGLVPV